MGILLLAKRVVKRLSTKYMSHNIGYSCENEAESENAHHKAIVSKYVASRVMLEYDQISIRKEMFMFALWSRKWPRKGKYDLAGLPRGENICSWKDHPRLHPLITACRWGIDLTKWPNLLRSRPSRTSI